MGLGFDFMFTVIPAIIFVGFIIVFGIFITQGIRGISGWHADNQSPQLTVQARIVAKRMAVHRHNHSTSSNNAALSSTSSSYFVTFEVESGDRMELHVPDGEYGLMVEGDTGMLTFQGTRFQGFARSR